MTDMRATERLLEVLHAQLTALHGSTDESISDAAADALDIVCMLRRRGDTLVRRDDLRIVLEEAISNHFSVEQEWSVTNGRAEAEHDLASGWTAAIERLQTQIGGTLP